MEAERGLHVDRFEMDVVLHGSQTTTRVGRPIDREDLDRSFIAYGMNFSPNRMVSSLSGGGNGGRMSLIVGLPTAATQT